MLIKLPNALYSVTFDKDSGTITVAGLGNVISAQVNRVVNVTDGIEIYGGLSESYGNSVKTTSPDELVLTLDYDTSAMDNGDIIEVVLDVNEKELTLDSLSLITGSGGGGGGGGGGAITSVDLGVKADAAASSDNATASLIALTKRGLIKDQARNDVLAALATQDTLAALNAKFAALSNGRTPVNADGSVVLGRMRGPISDSFTRPADTIAYVAGDTIQNATSSPQARQFTNLFPAGGGSGYVSIVAVVRNAAMTARLRIHLFATDPVTKVVDNAAFAVATGDEGAYLGYIDLDAFARGVACSSNRKEVVVSGTNLFYQIETLDQFTPASATNYLFKATLDANV